MKQGNQKKEHLRTKMSDSPFKQASAAVQWSALSPRGKQVGGVGSGPLHVLSLGSPASSHSQKTCMPGDLAALKLPVGVCNL